VPLVCLPLALALGVSRATLYRHVDIMKIREA
jgi:hypothetical protein